MSEFKGSTKTWKKSVKNNDIIVTIPAEFKGYPDRVLKFGHIGEDDCGVETCCLVKEHCNARLVASAPGLLYALENLLSACEGQLLGFPEMKLAKDIIAKALEKEPAL